MRRMAGVLTVVLVLASGCGGDDDDAVDVDLEPIAAVDPCELLDEDTATDLAGAEVELIATDDDPSACDYGFADESIGSGIAASLRLAPGDESDVPGGGIARALDLGDAGAVEETDTSVKVVYVVREVVVRIEIVPASGEVDDDLVDRVVEFAETTEAPVVEAVTGEEAAATTTTTVAAEPTSTTAAPSTTASPDAEIADLWGRQATEFRGQIGEQIPFECPGPGVLGTVWGTGTYTDDSSVCSAAVHSGVISLEAGGDVVIEITGPQDSWPASEANGVTSQEWPQWPGGFDVLGD